jgi:DNA-binding SARP family transcriptional activator
VPQSTASPQLVTLGRLALLDATGQPLLSADSAKLLALLAYLAARPGRRATRDHLIDLFWADSPVDKARNSLRQALHKLRAVLGEALVTEPAGDIVLRPSITTDRDRFIVALDAGDTDTALAIYAGPYAPGIVTAGSAGFEHWADNERERLHDHFVAAIESAAQRSIVGGNARDARALAQRLLEVSPHDERAWRLRVEAELAMASRVHVAATVAELQRALAANHRQPEPRTRQLIERLTRPIDPLLDADEHEGLVTDLVGREAEFGQLYHGWREAVARRAYHLHVTAQAGVGKTRLLDDFAFRLEAERARVVRIRATPRQRNVPGAALASLAAALVDLPGATGIADRSARILVDLQPALGTRFAGRAPLDAVDLGERRRLRVDALADLISALTDEGPLCLLLDDMHWWDRHSHDVVVDLIERLGGKALFVATASRPGTGLVNTSLSTAPLTLNALQVGEIAALLTSLGEATELASLLRLATALHSATDGVPLLVIEAVRLGLDRELLCLHDSRWNFARLDDYLGSLKPGAILAERIAALTTGQRGLLLLASVLEAPVEEVAATAIGVDAPMAALVELERLGMLAPQGSCWVVAHDVIAEVSIAAATSDALRHAHRVAGMLLSAPADTEQQVAEAAQHFVDAGDIPALARLCGAWVRRCRTAGDTRAGRDIARELLGPDTPATAVAEVLTALPPALRGRPWRRALIWPALAAAAVMFTSAGWLITRREEVPDATVEIFLRDSTVYTHLVVPLYANRWATTRGDLPTERASGRRGTFPGDPTDLSGGPQPSPNGREWIASHTVRGELGPTELVLTEPSGREHPVAPARGDDVSPSWSPDGRFVVFATTRWSAPGNASFDLGILDVTAGTVRRLTDDSASHERPAWSPDGTRISYLRKPIALAPDEVCWITVDARRRYCRPEPDGAGLVTDWLDNQTLLVGLRAGKNGTLAAVAADGTGHPSVIAEGDAFARLSPNGEWLLCDCATAETPGSTDQLIVLPVHQPAMHHAVHGVGGELWRNAFWGAGPRRPWLAQLRIMNQTDSIAIGASYRLSVEGTASDQSRLDPVPEVLRWRSADTAVATIDSVTGDVYPRRRGAAWIFVSAGGWRRDSTRVLVGDSPVATIIHENWDASWQQRWIPYGPDPKPTVVASRDIGHGITPNGNGTYADGVYSRGTFPAGSGIGVQAIVQAPVTRGKWQMIGFGIQRIYPIIEGVPSGTFCAVRYPAGEGWSDLHRLAGPDGSVEVPDAFATGKTFQLRVQIFPDGSCGVAINGRPVQRHTGMVATNEPLGVVISGQSVGTHMMVGPLTIWRGVRGEVDWSALGRDSVTAPRKGGH